MVGPPVIRLAGGTATRLYVTARMITGLTINGITASLTERDAESGRSAW